MAGKTEPVDVSTLPAWQQRFCRELRRQRKVQGLTGAQLAAKLGTHQVRISDWERAKRTPSIDNVLELAEALGTDFADLTGIGLDE